MHVNVHLTGWLQRAEDFPKVKVFHTARTLDEVILLAPLFDHPKVFDISLHYTGSSPITTHTLIMPSPVLLDGEDPGGHFAADTETLLQLQHAPNLKVYNGAASACIAASAALSKAVSQPLKRRGPEVSPRGAQAKAKAQKALGKEVGGFKKVKTKFAANLDPRLINIRGKWEGLLVWVGAWLTAFLTLVCNSAIHALYANSSHERGFSSAQLLFLSQTELHA